MKLSLYRLLPIFLAAIPAFAQKEDLPNDLAGLVAAEREFARTCVAKGVNESFLAFFAENGINFQPHPVNTRESILNEPPGTEQPPLSLNWEPLFADISAAGDLGYTTGPYVGTDLSPENRPPRHGYYFSVWKRQADGSWKVAIDAGISTPPPPAEGHPPLQTGTPGVLPRKEGDPEQRRNIPQQQDQGTLSAVRGMGLAEVFLHKVSQQARFHRHGRRPIIGRDSIIAYMTSLNLDWTRTPIGWDIAQSYDLGYSYGSYELREKGNEGKVREKGYYVRVWKREEQGKWRIVFDITQPLPPGEELRGSGSKE